MDFYANSAMVSRFWPKKSLKNDEKNLRDVQQKPIFDLAFLAYENAWALKTLVHMAKM